MAEGFVLTMEELQRRRAGSAVEAAPVATVQKVEAFVVLDAPQEPTVVVAADIGAALAQAAAPASPEPKARKRSRE